MRTFAETLAAFAQLAAEVAGEAARTQETRFSVAGLPGASLLDRAAAREAFNTRLAARTAHARGRLEALGRDLGASGLSAVLERLGGAEAAQLSRAVAAARGAAAALAEADAFERSLCARLLQVVRAWGRTLPAQAAAYQRSGAAAGAPPATTTSTTA